MLCACACVYAADGIPETKHLNYHKHGGLEYWLYQEKPDAKNQPLLIFLHGKGETTMASLLKWGPPKHIEKGKAFPGIVVTPLSPNGEWWRRERLIVFVDTIAKKYNVDLKRIYLTGLSMGGFASWDLACHYPGRFAALVPICGGGNPDLVNAIKDIPTQVFHGDKDHVVKMEKSTVMVEALKNIGGIVDYTIYPGVGHTSWIQAYADKKLYDWIYQQRKAQAANIDPHAELKHILKTGVQVKVEPRLLTNDLIKSKTLTITWHNQTMHNAQVRAVMLRHAQLQMRFDQDTFSLAAGARRTGTIHLDGLKNPQQELDELRVKWEVQYDDAAAAQMQFKQGYAFRLTPIYKIDKQTITVDGDLGDWSDAWIQVNKPRHIMNIDKKKALPDYQCTYAFQTAYDKNYLYVAVKVHDDTMRFLPQKNVWDQDGVEIRIDARAPSERKSYRDWHDFLPILISPQPEGGMTIWQHKRLPAGMQMDTQIREGFYTVELAVPINYVEQRAGKDWQRLRINVAVNDYDKPEQRGPQLWWYPDWRTALDSRMEGTFQRTKP